MGRSWVVAVLVGCSSKGFTPEETAVDTATEPSTTPETVVVEGCHATPRDADDHALWLAFPYDAAGGPSDLWRSYAYDGALTEVGDASFGRAWWGRGAWTPDGAFLFVVDDDGVVHGPANELAAPYTSAVTVDRTGETAWLVNPNWADSGGGVYRASIDCETGALGAPELVWTGKNTAAVVLRPGTASEAAIVTRELDGVPGQVHLVDLATGDVFAHLDAFGDDEAIVSDAAWDYEGERLLVADYSAFSGVSNRVAVVTDAGPVDVIEVYDPVSLATAPWPDGSALVVSGYGNAVYELERTEDSYVLGAEVVSLDLPGVAVGVARGAQRGRVLVTENSGLWELELLDGGGVVDHGRLLGGSGLTEIPGAIALQP